MDLTPGPAKDQERSDEPKIPREALIEAANALKSTDLDWCYECVGSDPAAMVAAQVVAAVLWPLAVRAGREDAAKAIEAVLTNPEVTYSLNNANDLEVRAGLETVRAVTPMMTETDAIRAALEGVVTDDHR